MGTLAGTLVAPASALPSALPSAPPTAPPPACSRLALRHRLAHRMNSTLRWPASASASDSAAAEAEAAEAEAAALGAAVGPPAAGRWVWLCVVGVTMRQNARHFTFSLRRPHAARSVVANPKTAVSNVWPAHIWQSASAPRAHRVSGNFCPSTGTVERVPWDDEGCCGGLKPRGRRGVIRWNSPSLRQPIAFVCQRSERKRALVPRACVLLRCVELRCTHDTASRLSRDARSPHNI